MAEKGYEEGEKHAFESLQLFPLREWRDEINSMVSYDRCKLVGKLFDEDYLQSID